MDFTLRKYKELLEKLINKNYVNLNYFVDYEKENGSKEFFLRHDVDRDSKNALKMAQIESELGLVATYYFRMVPCSYNIDIINDIKKLGHHIGYHYENLATEKGDMDLAYIDFKKNLDTLKKIADIKSICMHGSPTSKYDNRELWKRYSYKELGIAGEPYFDIDFNRVFYLTDASRSWNNDKISVRDKVDSIFNIKIKSTNSIIDLLDKEKLPSQVMISTHPHNWTDNVTKWAKILLWQKMKNIIKYFLIKFQ